MSAEEGNELAKKLKVAYFEVSAKTGKNVLLAFAWTATQVFHRALEGRYPLWNVQVPQEVAK